MPLFRIEVFKTYGLNPKPWANSYWGFCPTLADAVTLGGLIVPIERAVHSANVTFRYFRASEFDAPGTNYQTVPINLAGLTSAAEELPLFNTVRVDFGVTGGRPSYKYLRTPIQEAGQLNGTLETAYRTYIIENYAEPMLALSDVGTPGGPLTDEDGNLFDTVSVFPQVQMRSRTRRKRPAIVPS